MLHWVSSLEKKIEKRKHVLLNFDNKDYFEMNVPLQMTFVRPVLTIFSAYVCSSFKKPRF